MNEWSEIAILTTPLSFLQRTPANIRINLTLPETTFPGLHFCRWHWQYMGSSANFRPVLSEISISKSRFRNFNLPIESACSATWRNTQHFVAQTSRRRLVAVQQFTKVRQIKNLKFWRRGAPPPPTVESRSVPYPRHIARVPRFDRFSFRKNFVWRTVLALSIWPWPLPLPCALWPSTVLEANSLPVFPHLLKTHLFTVAQGRQMMISWL